MSDRRKIEIVAALVVLLGAVTGGCGETSWSEADEVLDLRQSGQSFASAMPQISVEGLENINDGVYLETMEVYVNEIRLVGLDGQPTVIGGPYWLEVDLASGESQVAGQPLVMEASRAYGVELDVGSEEACQSQPGIAIQGMARADGTGGDESDGNPLPLPADEKGALMSNWVDFVYQHHEVWTTSLESVEVTASAESFELRVEVDGWANTVVPSALEGLESSGIDSDEPLDLSQTLPAPDLDPGPEAFFGGSSMSGGSW